MEEKSVKVVIEVMAGIIPGEPMDEYTRRWTLSREEFNDQNTYFQQLGWANIYALSLMNPVELNWVKMEWVWL